MTMRTAYWCLLSLSLALLVSCGGASDDAPNHAAVVEEGREAVREVMERTQAASVSVALVDSEGVIWSEAFGTADRDAGLAATPQTLYGLCSISKMFATVAIMMLVERGELALDEPIVTYLPSFSMPLDERYEKITVRMLINHSSGIPAFESGEVSQEPVPEYAALLMEGIEHQRLLHEPGAMSGYNNDGFTMTQNLITAVTGKSYQDFVREEILTPLSMDTSQFHDTPLPERGYARSYDGDAVTPLQTLNIYATGGLFSTAEELSHLAVMLLDGGVYGTQSLLSPASIAAMARDQREGTFNPIPNESFRFGLGWDTIAQPGLEGVTGWQKGGDIQGYYGANVLVVPGADLAVVVLGATGSLDSEFTSAHATEISTRILLRALVERGTLPEMPEPLPSKDLPRQGVTQEDKDAFSGHYASSNGILRVRFEADDSLTVELFEEEWVSLFTNYQLRDDGWYAADGDPVQALQFVTRAEGTYLAIRTAGANPHYSTTVLGTQRLEEAPAISEVWTQRLAESWLPVNEELYVAFPTKDTSPSVRLRAIPGLPGYLAGGQILREMNPPSADRLDGMFLVAPDGMRAMGDAVIERRDGQDWLWLGGALLRPRSGVPSLTVGRTALPVAAVRSAEWVRLPASGSLTVAHASQWILFDEDISELDSGDSDGTITLGGSGEKYLALYGKPETEIELVLSDR